MKARSAGVRSGLARILTVIGVVAGVFAMHGLTSNHDPAMPGTGPAPASSRGLAETNYHNAESSHGTVVRMSVLPMVASAPLTSAVEGLQLHGSGAEHGMAGACVAVLTLTLLLLALAVASRWRRIWRTVRPGHLLVERPVPAGRPPPWLAPSLSKLCVLRT